MFETGEYVVYGRTGICQVTGVTTMKMDGSSSERLYYILRPGGETEGKIFTPVEGGKQVLRGIITKEEAEKLIDEIPSIETLSIENEKFREDSYKKMYPHLRMQRSSPDHQDNLYSQTGQIISWQKNNRYR